MSAGVIKRLVNELTVQDTMIHLRALKRADSYEQAKPFFPRFDVIPFPGSGVIEGFYTQASSKPTYLAPEHLISNSTSLFELPGLLALSPFYFVLSGNAVTGFVHYADLNRSVNRIPLYILIQYLEFTIWDRIDERVNERVVRQIFGAEGKGIIANHKRSAEHNVQVGWAGAFNFNSILRLGRHFDLIDLDDAQIELLKDARNKAAHSDQNLVNDYQDVIQLVEAYRLLSHLLEEL